MGGGGTQSTRATDGRSCSRSETEKEHEAGARHGGREREDKVWEGRWREAGWLGLWRRKEQSPQKVE